MTRLLRVAALVLVIVLTWACWRLGRMAQAWEAAGDRTAQAMETYTARPQWPGVPPR